MASHYTSQAPPFPLIQQAAVMSFGWRWDRHHRACANPRLTTVVLLDCNLILSRPSSLGCEASSITFLMNPASCVASTLGSEVVPVATGVPNFLKNSSWGAGEQMQSILAGFDEEL